MRILPNVLLDERSPRNGQTISLESEKELSQLTGRCLLAPYGTLTRDLEHLLGLPDLLSETKTRRPLCSTVSTNILPTPVWASELAADVPVTQ